MFSENLNVNLLYLYDLPKENTTSTKLAMIFKEQSGYDLEARPQINKNVTRPFYSGIINIRDRKQFETVCEKMRYFEIDGKACRSLKFDKTLTRSHREKEGSNQNIIFVRNIPS